MHKDSHTVPKGQLLPSHPAGSLFQRKEMHVEGGALVKYATLQNDFEKEGEELYICMYVCVYTHT